MKRIRFMWLFGLPESEEGRTRERELGRSSGVLVEPFDGSSPGLRRGDFVVSLRRGVIEESMNRLRPDVAFVRYVVFLQFCFIRGPGINELGIQAAMVHQYCRFDLRNVCGRWCAAIKGSGRGQVRTKQCRDRVRHAAAEAE